MRTLSASRDPGAEHDIGLDHDIAPEPRVGRQEHGLRRDQRRAALHRAAAQPVLHQRLGRGQLGAGVDPQHLLGRQFDDPARQALVAGDRDDVGQVEFALGVVVPDSVHQIEGVARIDRHDAAVAQPDRPLLRARVARLDDAQHLAVLPEHDTAVGSGIGRPHAGDGDRGAGARRRASSKAAIVSVRSSGASPNSTSTSSMPPSARRSARAERAARTASPVPRGGYCTTVCAGATARATASMSRPITTTVAAGSSGCSAAMTWRIIGCPAISCSTLGSAELRRVPSPAARMMAAKRDRLIDGLAQSSCGTKRDHRG